MQRLARLVPAGHDDFLESFSPLQRWIGLTFLAPYCLAWFTPWTDAPGRVSDWLHLPLMALVTVLLIVSLAPSLRWAREHPRSFIGWIVLAFVLVFILDALVWSSIIQPMIQSSLDLGDVANSNEETLRDRFDKAPVLMTFAVVVWGPVIEELMYRGVLFRSLADINFPLAHLLTALAFGIQHIVVAVVRDGQTSELVATGGYMIFSLVLTWAYRRSGSILPGIIAHGMVNALGVLTVLS